MPRSLSGPDRARISPNQRHKLTAEAAAAQAMRGLHVLVAAVGLAVLVGNLLLLQRSGPGAGAALQDEHVHVGVAHAATWHLRVISSRTRAAIEVEDVVVADANASGDAGRGITVAVLREDSGELLQQRRFDTYLPGADKEMLAVLEGVHEGRIVALAIRDEGTFSLTSDTRLWFSKLGSTYGGTVGWRDMWCLVFRVGRGVLAESHGKSASLDTWGPPATVVLDVPYEKPAECEWGPDASTRREFCRRYQGYGALCRCTHALALPNPGTPDGRIAMVPVAVMASDRRPQYLFRALLSLLNAKGVHRGNIVVFIDGLGAEAQAVCNLLGIKSSAHIAPSKKNGRIAQHYKHSLAKIFTMFPLAEHAIIHEEDVDAAPDYFLFFAQLLPLMQLDPTLYCVSAWNDLGYKHATHAPQRLYRVETMPGLGWLLARSIFQELEPKWPGADTLFDWDMWMRMPDQRKGRECIIPDVSRTFHFGASGVNMNPYFQEIHFNNRAISTGTRPQLEGLLDMEAEAYDALLERLVQTAVPVDHEASPCVLPELPARSTDTHILFIQMAKADDWRPWMALATCWKLWDLDARGFHKNVWRMHINGTPLMVVGSTSPFYKFRPKHVDAVAVPTKAPPK
eukprot:m.37711 g.37711  ORF g.37711 m.37711 type:complete len:626 (-) comp5460_c0_seq2:386-2263(-)